MPEATYCFSIYNYNSIHRPICVFKNLFTTKMNFNSNYTIKNVSYSIFVVHVHVIINMKYCRKAPIKDLLIF